MNLVSFAVEYPFVTAVLAVVPCYYTYYYFRAVKKPILACRDSPFREFLLKNMPILQRCFWPTPWCLDGRLQSIICSFVRWRLPDINYTRETLKLNDGGILSLDWESRPNRPEQPIVILLPGLIGSSQSEYLKGFILAMRDLDVCVVVFNHRGMGDTELKTSRTYCKANSDDFEEAVHHIHNSYPKSPFIAVGVSLGGMIVANYLASRGEAAAKYLDAGVGFSVSWNFFVSIESLETPGVNLLLNYGITKGLLKTVEGFKHQLQGSHHPWNYEHVMQSKTIRDFDDRFTSRNNGFRDWNHYYSSATLDDKIHNIKVPFLCLTAEDDFFQPLKGVPVDEIKKSSHVAVAITSHGGHVGFMEGLFPVETFYSDQFLGQFIRGVLEDIPKVNDIKKEGDLFSQMQ